MRLVFSLIGLGAILVAAPQSHTAVAGEAEKVPVLTVLERTADPLMRADRPWEDFCIAFCQALRVGDQWHLWYNSFDRRYRTDADVHFCYARSKDGVHWEKPSLGIAPYNDDKNNNILTSGCYVGSVFLDAKAAPAERFQAVGVRETNQGWWVYGGTSPDGIQWKWADKALLEKNSDTANVCIRDGDVYRLYVRMWVSPPATGRRVVGYSESATFGGFSDPVAVLSPDEGDRDDLNFYNSAATRLPDGLYLMFPSGLVADGTAPVYGAFSRDGKHFRRLGRAPLLELGMGFDSKALYLSPGAIPGPEAGTYWLYYLGSWLPHDDLDPKKVENIGGIGRFLLRVAD